MTDPQPHPLRERIDAARRITQAEVARRTGIQESTVSQILSGRIRPTPDEEKDLYRAVDELTAEFKEATK